MFIFYVGFQQATELVCESCTDSLGCKVGTCCPNLSSLSMCSSVVLPALSRPRNTNLPDFLYSPETKPGFFEMQAFIFQFCHSLRTWGVGITVMKDKTVSTFWGLLRHSHPSIADSHSGEMISKTFEIHAHYIHCT